MTTADRILLTFDIDKLHLYKMDDYEWSFAYQSNGTVTFAGIADPYRKVTYDVGTLNRMNGAGKIEMVPYGLLPQEMRPKTFQCDFDTTMAGLDPKTRQRANMREAMVLAYEDLYARGVFKAIDEQIAEAMPQIRDAAAELLAEFDLEYKAKLRDWKAGTGRKPQSKNTVAFPDSVSARQLRTWVSAYRNGGKRALVDNCKNRGNVNSFFTAEEIGLMAKVINEEYLTLQLKTIKIVAEHVKVEFAAVNKARAENGEAPLRVPSNEAVRKFIKRMNKFHVLVARFGQQEAMNRMRPTSMGVQVSRPLERVEMDECKIDLLTLLAKSGLLAMFAPEDRERLGLGDKKRRWWLIMAIDCRTRCILGMVLTANPNSVGTLKCLRMIVSDKGQFADKVGALAPWSMFGTPESIFVDNGSGLASALVTDACADLGTQKVQTIAGMASMRSQVEGIFNTLSVGLFPRLSGRTFGNVVERAKHPAEKRTCHSVDTLANVLVRYIVDVYHNTPHQGLGGRTPLQQ
ncbi:MAG: hypothetical protein JJ869_13745 [Marivita sp.]|uniref:integrase catalytic domain-containing protein n=1 Tax=Marivita sp. TaxID=2003365 RepID=UPI001B11A65F|nr:transposase family protein [Marivita sp.]MBO6884622.1 hypothetical protein [Marivita sp.]